MHNNYYCIYICVNLIFNPLFNQYADDDPCSSDEHAMEFGGYDEQFAPYDLPRRRRRQVADTESSSYIIDAQEPFHLNRIRRSTDEASLDILVNVQNPASTCMFLKITSTQFTMNKIFHNYGYRV